MVATGLGVYLVPEPVAQAVNHPGVLWATVMDIPPTPFSMCIPHPPASRLPGLFAELVTELFPIEQLPS